MKILFSLLILLSISTASGALTPKQLKCSKSGTDVILVNGISWGRDVVVYILNKQIKKSIPNKGYIDSKDLTGDYVKFDYSYNESQSFARDLLEASIQKLTQNFKIPVNTAFVYAYQYLYRGVVVVDFIESFLNPSYQNKALIFSNAVRFLNSTFKSQSELIEKATVDAFNKNVGDTRELKNKISKTLLSGRKLILITESQGNLFGRQAILDFKNGENLKFENKRGNINDYEDYIGQLLIAPPTGSILPKNKVVLNDKDIVQLVFFDRPDSNFNFAPPLSDPRVALDQFANHFITSTYLNGEEVVSGDLPRLKEFTLQSIVDLASLLESNCLKAIINYTKNSLQVSFDSIDPENPDVKGLTYSWNFGDGQTANTISKNISHTYLEPGNYNVSLIVTDTTNDRTYSVTENISVKIERTGDAAVRLCTTSADTSKFDYLVYTLNSLGQTDKLLESFSLSFTKTINSSGYPLLKCQCRTVNLKTDVDHALLIKATSGDRGDTIMPYGKYLPAENKTLNLAVLYLDRPEYGFEYYIDDESGWFCDEW